jgi:hypothetical protein
MDIKGHGFKAKVEVAEQTDEWLLTAAREIQAAATERGLEIPDFAGATVSDATVQVETVAEGVPETKESLLEQVSVACKGYSFVMNALNCDLRKKDRYDLKKPKEIASACQEWLTDKRIALVNKMKERQPGLEFTLIATPTVLTSLQDIKNIAASFGTDQPYDTYLFDKPYKRCAANQLSGVSEDLHRSVNFALIPNMFTPELDGTVKQQRAALAHLQTQHPSLRVPSVLDALTYWATLRAQQGSVQGDGTYDLTYIRHFDLPQQRIAVLSCVPESHVSDGGQPRLHGSFVTDFAHGRVAVG